jgi:hypothetical protein
MNKEELNDKLRKIKGEIKSCEWDLNNSLKGNHLVQNKLDKLIQRKKEVEDEIKNLV